MEAKIVLSLLVPGAKRLTQEFCEKNPKEGYNEEFLTVVYYKKNKKCNEKITIKTKKNELITHVINIVDEAYRYMISNPPSSYNNKKKWGSLSINQRLREHFDLIANDFNAVDYHFKILDS